MKRNRKKTESIDQFVLRKAQIKKLVSLFLIPGSFSATLFFQSTGYNWNERAAKDGTLKPSFARIFPAVGQDILFEGTRTWCNAHVHHPVVNATFPPRLAAILFQARRETAVLGFRKRTVNRGNIFLSLPRSPRRRKRGDQYRYESLCLPSVKDICQPQQQYRTAAKWTPI